MFLKALPLGVNLSLNLRCKAFTEVFNEKANELMSCRNNKIFPIFWFPASQKAKIDC